MSLNPEATAICPYNKAHVIVLSRMQYHLPRCRVQHPSTEKATCPFNSTHIINKVELEWHLEWCPERISGEREFIKVGTAPQDTFKPPAVEVDLPPPPCLKEVWDDEVVGGESVLEHVRDLADSKLTLKNKICVSKSVRKEHKMNERRKFIEASNKAPQSPTSPKTAMPPAPKPAPSPQAPAQKKSEEPLVRADDFHVRPQPMEKKAEPVQLPIKSQERKAEPMQLPLRSQERGSINTESARASNSERSQPWNGWNKMNNTEPVSQAMSELKLNQEVDRLSQRNPNNPWGARLPQTAGNNFSEDFPSLGLPVSGRGRRIQTSQMNHKMNMNSIN